MKAPVWLWPAAAIALIAFAGQIFGAFAALLAAAEVAGTTLFVGAARVGKPWRRAIASALSIALCAGLIVAGLSAIKVTRHTGVPSAPAPLSPTAAYLPGRAITSAMLAGLDFRGADLRGAQLDHLDLSDKTFNGADASGASFQGSQLEGVSMRGADLSGAQMQGACLLRVDFSGANLDGVDVKGAEIGDDVGVPPAVARDWAAEASPLAAACDLGDN